MATRLLVPVFILICLVGCLNSTGEQSAAEKEPKIPSATVSATAPVPSPDPAGEALFYFSQAQLLAVEGDFAGALAALEQALERDPQSAYLRLFQAELYLSLDEEEQAVRAAEDALIQAPDDPDIHQLLANLYFQQGKDPQAIAHLKKVVELTPEDQNAYLKLGIAYARSGDAEQAVAVLKRLLEKDPEAVLAQLTLARIYREIGLTSLAEDTFREIIDRHPDLESTYLELASLYQQQGAVKKVLALFREAVKNNPDNSALRIRLIRFLAAIGQLDAALVELDVLNARRPKDPEGYRLRGLVLMEKRQWPAAARAFSRALELDPGSDQVRFYLGTVHEKQEEWSRAVGMFLAISPESELYGDATSHLAYLYHRLDRIDDAIKVLAERLPELEPRAEHYSYLASLYEERRQFDEARAVLDRGLESLPESAELHFRLGLHLERLEDSSGALEAMKRAIALDPKHAEALNFVAYSYAERGEKLDEALDLAQRAAALNNEGHILDTLGWVYFKSGRLKEARGELEAAAALMAEDPIVLGHLGDLYRALGLTDRARTVYRRVLELAPDDEETRKKLDAIGG